MVLQDKKAIEIISKAQQKNVRDPRRSRAHFESIFADFLSDQDLASKTLLDLGPGQYDFAELATARGAETHGIDKDPAVVELGRYKKFRAIQADLRQIDPETLTTVYDGLFCKFSINAFWFHLDTSQLVAHVDRLCRLLKPDGWSWIAPWNGVPKKAELQPSKIQQILQLQADQFRRHGFSGFDLTRELSIRYGVHGSTANRALFVRNLTIPSCVEGCSRL